MKNHWCCLPPHFSDRVRKAKKTDQNHATRDLCHQEQKLSSWTGKLRSPMLHQESHTLEIPEHWHQMQTTPDSPIGEELTGQFKRCCHSEDLHLHAEPTLRNEWNT